MKKFLKKLMSDIGYEVRRMPVASVPDDSVPIQTTLIPGITDFDSLANAAAGIPSMLGTQTALSLYQLCYLQELRGDVVEVGSWQGYSTSFLARAVRDSGNGVLYAIDHFRGNVGKEQFYVVGSSDLSDLRHGFEHNIRNLGLWDSVRLLDMPNCDAVCHLDGVEVRMLFIDGDHSKSGVENDIRLFYPLVKPGGIIIFDDFAPHFPGLVEAVTELISTYPPARVFCYRNTLVIRK